MRKVVILRSDIAMPAFCASLAARHDLLIKSLLTSEHLVTVVLRIANSIGRAKVNMRGVAFFAHILSIVHSAVPTEAATARQDGRSSGGNVSLQHPELFSLHWRMLEQNSTSGYETPMVDFLSGYLKGKGLTVALQPVQNPILACVMFEPMVK